MAPLRSDVTVPLLWELALQFGEVVRVCIPNFGPVAPTNATHGRDCLLDERGVPIGSPHSPSGQASSTAPAPAPLAAGARVDHKRSRSVDGSDMELSDEETGPPHHKRRRYEDPREPISAIPAATSANSGLGPRRHAFVEFASLQDAQMASYCLSQLSLFDQRLEASLAHSKALLQAATGHVFVWCVPRCPMPPV